MTLELKGRVRRIAMNVRSRALRPKVHESVQDTNDRDC